VVGFAIELDQIGAESVAHVAHGVFGEGEHVIGEDRTTVFWSRTPGGRGARKRCGGRVGRAVLSPVAFTVGGVQMRYRYRMEPTPGQQQMLARVFGCTRVVFNDALRVRDEAYRPG
jgi:hypothetical protein